MQQFVTICSISVPLLLQKRENIDSVTEQKFNFTANIMIDSVTEQKYDFTAIIMMDKPFAWSGIKILLQIILNVVM